MKKLKIVKNIIIAGAAAVSGIVLLSLINGRTSADTAENNHATVQKMDLDNSIGIIGKGVSDQVNYLYADISAPVKEINVHTGDTVHAGDIICSFDVNDLIEQRDSYKQMLEDLGKYSRLRTENRSMDAVYEKELLQKQMSQLDNSIGTARDKYNEAVSAEQNYNDLSNAAAAEAEQLRTDYEAADSEIESIKSEIDAYDQARSQTYSLPVIENDSDDSDNSETDNDTDISDPDNIPEISDSDSKHEDDTVTVPPLPYDTERYTYLAENSAKLKALCSLAENKKQFYDLKKQEAHSNAETFKEVIRGYEAEYAQYKAQNFSAGTMNTELRDDLIDESRTKDEYIQKIEELNKKIAGSTIIARTDGIITEIYVSAGDYVINTPVCQIRSEDEMHFEGYLNPDKKGDISTENNILISMASNNYEMTEGNIISIDDYYDPVNGGYKILFTSDVMDDAEIYPGTEVAARIIISQQKEALAVPYDCIFEKDGKFFVNKISKTDNSTECIEVEKGLETGYYVAVSSDKLNVSDAVEVVLHGK